MSITRLCFLAAAAAAAAASWRSLQPVSRCYHPQSHIRMLFVLRFSFSPHTRTHTRVRAADSKRRQVYLIVYISLARKEKVSACLSCRVCRSRGFLLKTKHHIRGILPPHSRALLNLILSPWLRGSNLVVGGIYQSVLRL